MKFSKKDYYTKAICPICKEWKSTDKTPKEREKGWECVDCTEKRLDLKADLKEYSNEATKGINDFIVQHPKVMEVVIDAAKRATDEKSFTDWLQEALTGEGMEEGVRKDVKWEELGWAWFNTVNRETTEPTSTDIIEKLPTLDKPKKIDELLEQLSNEQDPAKKEQIKQHIERIKRGSLKQADELSEPITPYKEVEDRGAKEISKYDPEYEFLVRLVKLITKEGVPPQEIKALAEAFPFKTIDDVGDLTAKIWTLATEKYKIPREWLISKLPEKKGSLNKKADNVSWWISPTGEVFDLEDERDHQEWMQEYGPDFEGRDPIEEGWTRIRLGNKELDISVNSINTIPKFLDDFLIQHPTERIAIEDGYADVFVPYEEVVASGLQRAINKSLSQKRMETQADLWPAQELSENTITQAPGAVAYNNPKDTTVCGPNPIDLIKQEFLIKHSRWSDTIKALKEKFPSLTDEEISSLKTQIKSTLTSKKQAKKKKLTMDQVIKILDSKEPKVVHIDFKGYTLDLSNGSTISFDEATKRALEMDKTGLFQGSEFSNTEFNVNPTLDLGPYSSPCDQGKGHQKSPFPNSNYLPASDDDGDAQPYSNVASNLNRPFSKKAYHSDLFNFAMNDPEIRKYFKDRGIDTRDIKRYLPYLNIQYWNDSSPVQGKDKETTVAEVRRQGLNLENNLNAYYYPPTGEIFVNPKRSLEDARDTLKHEIEHALQDSEGILRPSEEWQKTPYDIRTHEWGAELPVIRDLKNKGYSLEQVFQHVVDKANRSGAYIMPVTVEDMRDEARNKIEQLYELADEVEPASVVSNLNKQANPPSRFWIAPDGKEFSTGSSGHGAWIKLNKDILNRYGVNISTIGYTWPDMIQKGWTRVSDEPAGTGFTIEVNDLKHVPLYLDNFISKYFKEGDSIVIGSQDNFVRVDDPFPSIQKAVNKALRNPVHASRKQASSIENVGNGNIYVDPTWEQAKALLKKAKYKDLRGVIDPYTGGHLYLWDAADYTHIGVIESLGLGIDPFSDNDDDYISVIGDESGLRWMFEKQQEVKSKLHKNKKRADISGQIVRDILEIVESSGGITYSMSKGNLAGTDNYSVSVYPDREVINPGVVEFDDIQHYLDANKDLLSQLDNSLGIWTHEGKVFYDVVVTIPDMEQALELARKNNQLAIWDLKHGKEISTGIQRNVAFCKKDIVKKAEEFLLTEEQQNQVAAKWGPVMNIALNNYASAIKNGHESDRAFEYAVEMTKNMGEVKAADLKEAISVYLGPVK